MWPQGGLREVLDDDRAARGHRITARSLLQDVLQPFERVDPSVVGVHEAAQSVPAHHDARAVDREHPTGRLSEVAQHVLYLEPVGRGAGEVSKDRDKCLLINHGFCLPNGSGGRSGTESPVGSAHPTPSAAKADTQDKAPTPGPEREGRDLQRGRRRRLVAAGTQSSRLDEVTPVQGRSGLRRIWTGRF